MQQNQYAAGAELAKSEVKDHEMTKTYLLLLVIDEHDDIVAIFSNEPVVFIKNDFMHRVCNLCLAFYQRSLPTCF